MDSHRLTKFAVHGIFSVWSDWSNCQKLHNGTWAQIRTRSCQKYNGGMDCIGFTEDYTIVNCDSGLYLIRAS